MALSSSYVALGIAGLSALGLYAWSKKKSAAGAPASGGPAPGGPASPGAPGTALPGVPGAPGSGSPGSLALDWQKFGYDLGFAQGAKDKLANTSTTFPEPPASELAKAGVDADKLRAGYAMGYVDGQKSITGPVVKGSWYGGSYLPDYWKSVTPSLHAR